MGCPKLISIGNFQPRPRLDHQARVHLKISNQIALHITYLRSISEFSQEISMYCPKHTSSYRPSKNPTSYPSARPFQNLIPTNPFPHTQPTTYSNLPPSLLPLVPLLLQITHGLYQAGGHTGHTVLIIKAGSHFRVQSWMQLCIQLCTGVKKIF